MSIAYYNSDFILLDKAYKVESDRGVFTTILIEDSRAYFLEKHLDRLNSHAKALGLPSKKICYKVLFQLIKKNRAESGLWRLRIIITNKLFLITLQKEVPSVDKISLNLMQEPFSFSNTKLKTLANFKRLDLLDNSRKKGFSDCIIFDEEKNILETSIANIFWVKDGAFYYPDPSLSYLCGITLLCALEIAREMNLNISKGSYKLRHLENASVFYCNSIKRILLVEKIEGVKKMKVESAQWEFIHRFHEKMRDYSTCLAL